MKLSKTIFAATAVSAFCVTAASALTVDQCEQLGGNVDLVEAECELTAAQEDEARALGWLPGGSAAATATGLGTVAGSGGLLAAGGGLILTAVLIGDGSSSTTTTTGS
jgi:hypothetical protein